MDRRLQVALAIFFVIFVFIILILPQIDLPDSTRPSRSLAGVVNMVIAVMAMLSVAVVKFTLLLHPPTPESHYSQTVLYEGLADELVCTPLLC